jgi:hypothetical protein
LGIFVVHSGVSKRKTEGGLFQSSINILRGKKTNPVITQRNSVTETLN